MGNGNTIQWAMEISTNNKNWSTKHYTENWNLSP
jgi:hypothetical protein